MTLRYLAQLRRLMGRSTDEVAVSHPTTVEDVIQRIASPHLLHEGRMRRSLLVFRGEERLHPDSVIEGPCVLDVMSPIAGG